MRFLVFPAANLVFFPDFFLFPDITFITCGQAKWFLFCLPFTCSFYLTDFAQNLTEVKTVASGALFLGIKSMDIHLASWQPKCSLSTTNFFFSFFTPVQGLKQGPDRTGKIPFSQHSKQYMSNCFSAHPTMCFEGSIASVFALFKLFPWREKSNFCDVLLESCPSKCSRCETDWAFIFLDPVFELFRERLLSNPSRWDFCLADWIEWIQVIWVPFAEPVSLFLS